MSLTRTEARAPGAADVPCGLTRVDFVRVIVGRGGLRYEAVGEGHRHRSECPLTAPAALGLIGRVPFVVRRRARAGVAR